MLVTYNKLFLDYATYTPIRNSAWSIIIFAYFISQIGRVHNAFYFRAFYIPDRDSSYYNIVQWLMMLLLVSIENKIIPNIQTIPLLNKESIS